MLTRRRTDEDFTEEIRAHITLETDRLIAEGLTPEEARAAATRTFGNPTRVAERYYTARRPLGLDRFREDLRSAYRALRRAPVASAVAILSLGAGIGATTASLTVRNAVFRNPPPLYTDPAALSRIQVERRDRLIMPLGSPVPGSLFRQWRDELAGGVAGVAGAAPTVIREIRAGDRRETAPNRPVSSDLFALLGVRPALGAGFDVTPSGPPAAVLSDRLFESLFDRDPTAIGRPIWIGDRAYVVAGVMPARFWFAEMDAPVWTALDDDGMRSTSFQAVVRRPAGLTDAALARRLESGLAVYAASLPAADRDLRLAVSAIGGTPLAAQMSMAVPYILGAAVVFTLFIACANVAVLLIAQWTGREQETAVRAALGAGRGRLLGTLLTESVVIAVAGGALGVAAAFALRNLLLSRMTAAISLLDFSMDGSLLLQSAAIAVAAGLGAGLAPAVYETRRVQHNPLATIRSSDRVRQRWRHTLVVAEITLTIAMLVVVASMVNGYNRALHADMGFDEGPLAAVRIVHEDGPGGPGRIDTRRVLEMVLARPGIASAAISTSVPYLVDGPAARVASDASGANEVIVERAAVTPDFFRTLGVTLGGRTFRPDETPRSGAVIINERLARALFAGQSSVGRYLWLEGAPHEVVGVAADYSTRRFRRDDPPSRVYVPFPMEGSPVRRVQLLIRANGDAAAAIAALRRDTSSALPGYEIATAFTFTGIVATMGEEVLIGTAPLAPLVVIGLALSAAGIYGVLAFAITRRSKELAVRAAIGASARDLGAVVAAHGLRLVAIGSALGVGLTFVLSRIVRAGGGAGSPMDPAWHSFAVPVAILLLVGAAAAWIPARRAMKIDPVVLLREP